MVMDLRRIWLYTVEEYGNVYYRTKYDPNNFVAFSYFLMVAIVSKLDGQTIASLAHVEFISKYCGSYSFT